MMALFLIVFALLNLPIATWWVISCSIVTGFHQSGIEYMAPNSEKKYIWLN